VLFIASPFLSQRDRQLFFQLLGAREDHVVLQVDVLVERLLQLGEALCSWGFFSFSLESQGNRLPGRRSLRWSKENHGHTD
jgi:hypothetical protein